VEHLIKHYGEIKAVDDIDLRVETGEVFGMLGPNGAGKTTTVEIVEGLREADSGKVTVLGLDASKASVKIKQQIGIQLQGSSLMPQLRVDEIIDLFASFYSHSLPVDRLLDQLALRESRKVLVKNLSGGQQQRLSVALALVNDPSIAFLDEPTTGLDPQARRGVWNVIEEMKSKHKTVFLTTHYMEEAERLCDRLVIIDYGHVIAAGSPRELISEQFRERAIQFDMDPPPAKEVLEEFPGVTNVAINGSEVIVYTQDIPAAMSAILKFTDTANLTGRLKDLHVREATLEDVFLKLTGRRIRE
jgi:ABC-2 type transport system ATP-binding protein